MPWRVCACNFVVRHHQVHCVGVEPCPDVPQVGGLERFVELRLYPCQRQEQRWMACSQSSQLWNLHASGICLLVIAAAASSSSPLGAAAPPSVSAARRSRRQEDFWLCRQRLDSLLRLQEGGLGRALDREAVEVRLWRHSAAVLDSSTFEASSAPRRHGQRTPASWRLARQHRPGVGQGGRGYGVAPA